MTVITWSTFLKRIILVGIFLVSSASLCCADTFYALIAHKSKHNNFLTQLVKCPNETTCKEILKVKSVDLDSNWKFAEAECLSGSECDNMYRAAFNKEPISEPYIYFIDQNNLPTILKFMDIYPSLVDIMINRWAQSLEKQGMKGVAIIRAKK